MKPSIDGYDFPFYIAEEAGLHRELRGTIRPCAETEYGILDEQPFTDEQVTEHQERLARFVQSKITSVDETAGEGEWMAYDRAIVMGSCPPLLYSKIKALVFSERPNDDDPQGIAKPITAQQFVEENHTNLRRGFSLLLNHPAVATTSCAECKEWWFNPKEGTFEERPRGTRLKRPVDKDGNIHLPCAQCPKGSPEKEHETKLLPRNRKVAELLYQYLATGWEGIPREWRGDQLLAANLSVAAGVHRRYEREKLAESIAAQLAPFLTRTPSGIGALA